MEEKISDIVPDKSKKRARELADDHVDWLIEIGRPLLRTEFLHGFRHGFEEASNEATEKALKILRDRESNAAAKKEPNVMNTWTGHKDE